MKAKKIILKIIAIVLALLYMVACSDLGGSRDVNNASLSGRVLAEQVCSGCPQVTGESISSKYPKLAGQQKDYLIVQLSDFKSHQRKDQLGIKYMWGFTHLTTAQIDEIATYFSEQVPMQGKGTDSEEMIARGEKIFLWGKSEQGVIACTACHGKNAQGRREIPRLAGQHSDYIIKQIEVFTKTEQRPRGAVMKEVIHLLTLDEINAVAYYLASLNPKN